LYSEDKINFIYQIHRQFLYDDFIKNAQDWVLKKGFKNGNLLMQGAMILS